MAKFLNNLSIFLILVALLYTEAQSVRDGSCAKPKPMKNFDTAKFNLLWYQFASTPVMGNQPTHCTQYQHHPAEGKNWPISEYSVDADGKKHNFTTTFQITGKGTGNAHFTHVGTDYKTYAAIYTCKDLEDDKHSEILYVFSNTTRPVFKTILPAFDAFEKNHIDFGDIRPTDLSDCPDSWDDAEHDE